MKLCLETDEKKNKKTKREVQHRKYQQNAGKTMLLEFKRNHFKGLFMVVLFWQDLRNLGLYFDNITAQKLKFFIKDFFSKCDQIHRRLRIWSHVLKKFLMKNSISVQCIQCVFPSSAMNFATFHIKHVWLLHLSCRI